ncbi:MAG: hypothetical protein ACNS63_00115 [Candidatus Nitrospinota bacterium M3_3B_026]
MLKPALYLGSVHFERGPGIWGMDPAAYAELERGFKKLSRRALLMAGTRDTVIVDSPPDTEYAARLRALGAGGERIITPSNSGGTCLSEDAALSPETLDFLRGFEGRVEVYMPSRAEERLAEAAGRPIARAPSEVVDLLNDKIFFLRILEDIGTPMMETFVGNADAAAQRLRRESARPLMLRAGGSVGGSRVWPVRSEAEKAAAIRGLDTAPRGGLYILQPLLEAEYSPNLQFYIDDETARLFGETAQVMDGMFRHSGNVFDRAAEGAVREELLRQGAAIALEAASLGYRGVLGVDFIVTPEGMVYAVEMNARWNTSTHALWFLNRLMNAGPLAQVESGRGAFVRFPAGGLSVMEWIEALGEDVLDPDTGRGVLPCDGAGPELAAVIAGEDADDRRRLMERARAAAEKTAAGALIPPPARPAF